MPFSLLRGSDKDDKDDKKKKAPEKPAAPPATTSSVPKNFLFKVGGTVEIHSLKSKLEFNGLKCAVLAQKDLKQGLAYQVRLPDGTTQVVLEKNLKHVLKNKPSPSPSLTSSKPAQPAPASKVSISVPEPVVPVAKPVVAPVQPVHVPQQVVAPAPVAQPSVSAAPAPSPVMQPAPPQPAAAPVAEPPAFSAMPSHPTNPTAVFTPAMPEYAHPQPHPGLPATPMQATPQINPTFPSLPSYPTAFSSAAQPNVHPQTGLNLNSALMSTMQYNTALAQRRAEAKKRQKDRQKGRERVLAEQMKVYEREKEIYDKEEMKRQQGVDPVLGLKYVPAEEIEAIPAVHSLHKMAMFFVGPVRKINHSMGSSKRVLFLTHSAVAAVDLGQSIKRYIPVKDITSVRKYEEGREMWIVMQVTKQRVDLVVVMGLTDGKRFLPRLEKIYKHVTKRDLVVRNLTDEQRKTIKKDYNLQKPEDFKIIANPRDIDLQSRARRSFSPQRHPPPKKPVLGPEESEEDDVEPDLPMGGGLSPEQFIALESQRQPLAAGSPAGVGMRELASQLEIQDLRHQMTLQQILHQQQLMGSPQASPPRQHHQPEPAPAPAPSSSTAPGAGAGPSPSEYRQRIVTLYQIHDPKKTPQEVQRILEQYAGAESELYEAMLARVRGGEPMEKPATVRPDVAAPASPALPPSPPRSPKREPEALVKINGASRALYIVAAAGDAVRSADSLSAWFAGQLRPASRRLQRSTELAHPSVLGSLRWLGEGSRPGDVLLLYFCGSGEGGNMCLPGGSCVTPAELRAALLAELPRGVRLVVLMDTYPASSIVSLQHRLVANRPATALPGEAFDSDILVVSAAGGTVQEAGGLTSTFLRVMQNVPTPSHNYILTELAAGLSRAYGPAAPVPQMQSTTRIRGSAPFAMHGLPDDSPPSPRTPTPTSPDFAPPVPVVTPHVSATPHVSVAEEVPRHDQEREELVQIIRETFAQADDTLHPNHATAAGTVGSWMLEGSLGVAKDEDAAIRYLQAAARAGDGPSIARLRRLGVRSPVPMRDPSPLPESVQPSHVESKRSASGVPPGHLAAPPVSDTDASRHVRSLLAAYLAARSPQALGSVNAIVDEFRGREGQLLQLLRQRYPDGDWGYDVGPSVRPGALVTVDPDVAKVQAAVLSSVSIAWAPQMALYCGAQGTVLALDEGGNAKVTFSDGRVTWWPPSALSPQTASTMLQLLPEPLPAATAAVPSPGPGTPAAGSGLPTGDDGTPVVRLTLRQPVVDPMGLLAVAATLLAVDPASLQLHPSQAAAQLRLRVVGMTGAMRVTRELVARCRDPMDTLRNALGAIAAEMESEGFEAHLAALAAPPPLTPLEAASPEYLASPRTPFTHSSPTGEKQAQHEAAINELRLQVERLESSKKQKRTRSSDKKRVGKRTDAARSPRHSPRRSVRQPVVGARLASTHRKLYGDSALPVQSLPVYDSDAKMASAPEGQGGYDRAWMLMTETERRREEERDLARRRFEEEMHEMQRQQQQQQQQRLEQPPQTPRTPHTPHATAAVRGMSPPRPPKSDPTSAVNTPLHLSSAPPHAAAAAQQLLSILDDPAGLPGNFPSQVSTNSDRTAAMANLHLLRQREAMRRH